MNDIQISTWPVSTQRISVATTGNGSSLGMPAFGSGAQILPLPIAACAGYGSALGVATREPHVDVATHKFDQGTLVWSPPT